jgi:predicted ribosome quality control (RQC) complex YloA/Tae2 family protein
MLANYFFLKHLSDALNIKLKNFFLEQCFSQEKDELIMVLRKEKEVQYLKISLKPNDHEILLLDQFQRARKNSVDLWTDLYGQEILNIHVFNQERAFNILFNNEIRFVFKFFGNKPNLLIYRGQTMLYIFNNRLKADLGLEWQNLDKDFVFSKGLFEQNFPDINSFFPILGKENLNYAAELTADLNLEQAYIFYSNFIHELGSKSYFYICLKGEKVVLSQVPIAQILFETDDIFNAQKQFSNFYFNITFFQERKSTLNQTLNKRKQKLKAYIFEKENSLSQIIQGIGNEKLGHLIMANLHQIKADAEEITLDNFYAENEKIKISLKKNISPQKNAEWYYRKAKNEKINIEILEENLAMAKERLIFLQKIEEELFMAENHKQLSILDKKLSPKPVEAEIEELFKVFEFEDYEIFVGRNAKNNDMLTLKFAKKDDYWFHAKDVSGSHVVVKKKPGQNISEEVAVYAATLAAFHSKRKTDSVVPVIYTQKRYVRKTKGLPDGKVLVDRYKTLMVSPKELND